MRRRYSGGVRGAVHSVTRLGGGGICAVRMRSASTALARSKQRTQTHMHTRSCICDVYVAAHSLTRSVHLSFRTVVSPSLFAAARDVDDDDDDCMWKRACNISRLVNIV